MALISRYRPISKSVKWGSRILVGLPVAQVLEDIFIFEVGPFFFTPIKFVLLLGGLTLFKYTHPDLIARSKIGSPVLSLFFLYLTIQSISVFYASNLTILQKINYSLFNIATLVIVYALSRFMVKNDYQYLINIFSKTIKIIFYSSLLFATAQLLLKDQIFNNIGSFPSSNSEYVSGFNFERLFLCEFLTLGLAIILLQNPKQYFKKLILFFWVFAIIYATKSFTGMLGFTLLLLVIHRLNPLRFLSILLLGGITYIYLVPILQSELFTEAENKNKEFRFKKITDFETDSWRYVSSIHLLSEVLDDPTVFGHGYKENEPFLQDVWRRYVLQRYGKSDTEIKNMSTHTSLSVLYDQGIIGFLIVLLVLTTLFKYCHKFYFLKNINPFSLYIFRITTILSGLMALRFIFYYHSIHRWHFLVAIIFLNASYYLYKTKNYKTEKP